MTTGWKHIIFCLIAGINITCAAAQNGRADSSCIRCEARLQRIVNVWDSIIINHDEVKLVGFEKKYNFPADTAAILKIYQNDSAFTGYVIGNNKEGLIVRLLPLYKTSNAVITDSFRGDTVKISFGPGVWDPEYFRAITKNASCFYFIVYEYRGQKVKLPAICYQKGDFINTPVLMSTPFFENGLN